MRLTRKQLEQLAYDTMDEYNRKLGTYFSANTVELAFFTPKNGVAVYEEICTRYFKRHLSEKYKSPGFFENFAAMAMIGDINEYSAKVEHPDRFELNSATAQIEQSNRRN